MSAILLNQGMRGFTGTMPELFEQYIHPLESEVMVLEANHSNPARLDYLKAQLQYLYDRISEQKESDVMDSQGYPRQDPFTFADYSQQNYDALLTSRTEAVQQEAILNFKMTVQLNFLRFMLPFSKNGELAFPAPDKYQYFWNWFEQRNLPNPDLIHILYPITTYDQQWNIPSNPEAYSPYENGLSYEDYQKLDNPETENDVSPTINPYTDPNVYVFDGLPLVETDVPIDKHTTCPPGYHKEANGACVADAIVVTPPITPPVTPPADQSCPAGQHKENGVCVADVITPIKKVMIGGFSINPLYLIAVGAVVLIFLIRKSE